LGFGRHDCLFPGDEEEGVERHGVGSWLKQVQHPSWGVARSLSPRIRADLQGPQKLIAALNACDVKKQVDGP
jgi:hypothetical protein